MRVLVTGASGYIGGKLARSLAESPEVEIVVGVDVRPAGDMPEKFRFVQMDVRDPLDAVMEGNRIDTVVHTAWILPPLHDQGLMEDINLNGTRNVMGAARRAGVKRILYTSSATAYGFHPDNRLPLREDDPIRGNDDFTYCRTKRIIEGEIASFQKDNPGIAVIVVRPCFVVGPGFDNPLTNYLRKKFVPIPVPNSPLQLVHEDDLIDICLRLLASGLSGVFNVGGDGVLGITEMARMLGNIPVSLSFGLSRLINSLAWKLHLSFVTEFPSPALNMLRYGWVVSSDKLKKELGFEYRYDTCSAFEAFVRHEKEKG